jgi:hypothetical protein
VGAVAGAERVVDDHPLLEHLAIIGEIVQPEADRDRTAALRASCCREVSAPLTMVGKRFERAILDVSDGHALRSAVYPF